MSIVRAAPADTETRNWIFSGFELIEELQGQTGDGKPKDEPGRILLSARANSYIAGVADITSGTRWCGAGRALPHELADKVYTYSRTLGPERLKENASMLVTEALAAAFPCRAPTAVDPFQPRGADNEF
ncbi:hypothetical protein XW59_018375 [Aquamicrobium sp. LC103]|nr:hypothetical protein XW59_018375 [Aquamicrobium sp. LC103]